MVKNIKRNIVFIALLLSSGCSSLFSQYLTDKEPQDKKSNVLGEQYRGTKLNLSILFFTTLSLATSDVEEDCLNSQDVEKCEKEDSEYGTFSIVSLLLTPFALIDLPFSFILDTIFYVNTPEKESSMTEATSP